MLSIHGSFHDRQQGVLVMSMDIPVLEVKNLSVGLRHTAHGHQQPDCSPLVLDGINLNVKAGESVGLVGESGAGKTMLTRAIFKILSKKDFYIENGTIAFKGKNILTTGGTEFRKLLGSRMSLLFQEPSSTLDPVFTVGQQMVETVLAHLDLEEEEAISLTRDWLRRTGLSNPDRIMDLYPFELSGGMQQRAALALSLILRPELLVADEPTTALDSTLKVLVLELIQSLRKDLEMALLLVSHDLASVVWCCDRTAVLFSGVLVEIAPTGKILDSPVHPYTRELLSSARRDKQGTEKTRGHPQCNDGCPYVDRCSVSRAVCRTKRPSWREVSPGHRVRCYESTS